MAVRGALIDLGPLRCSPAYRRLWLGRTISGFGSQFTLIAVMFQVWQQTRSTVWTGAVSLAEAIPLLTLGLFAGAVVDRIDRRAAYLVALSGQGACAVLLAVQGFSAHPPVLLVLGLVAAQATFGTAGAPAARTFIRRLLPESQLPAGLALERIAFQGAMLAGPAVGGLVLGWVGVGGCYLVDAATFLVALGTACTLPRCPRDGAAARPGARGVLDGLALLVRTPVLRGVLLIDLAATALSMPVSLFPLINAERFGDNPRTLGLFLTAIAVGGVLASFFSGTFTRLPRPGTVMIAGSAGWGVSLALFGLAPSAWLGLVFLALAGAADTLAVVARGTVVQLTTPDEFLGRVVAAETIVGRAGPDLGNLRGGLVANATSATFALLSGGLLCVAAVAAVAISTPGLRRFTVSTERVPN